MAKVNDTNTVRYVRRMPRETYGHEEAEIVVSVPEGQDAFDVLSKAKDDVLDILDGNYGDDADESDFESLDEVDEVNEVDPIEEEMPEEVAPPVEEEKKVKVEEEPAPKKKGRKPKAKPVEDEDAIEVDGEDDFGFDEDEPRPVKNPAKKTKTKKASTPFDRTNKTHQTLISGLFTQIMPTWKTDLDKGSLKELASELNGKEFLDGDGEILATFKTRVKDFVSDEIS